jgi:hypothetical protein
MCSGLPCFAPLGVVVGLKSPRLRAVPVLAQTVLLAKAMSSN